MKGQVTRQKHTSTTLSASVYLDGQEYTGRIYFYVGTCGDVKGELYARTKKGLKRLRTINEEPVIIPEYSGRTGYIYGNFISIN